MARLRLKGVVVARTSRSRAHEGKLGIEGNVKELIVGCLVEIEQLLRWAPGRTCRRQGCGQVEVGQDGLDDCGIFDRLNGDHSVIAARAAQDVMVKHVLEKLGPRPTIRLGYGVGAIAGGGVGR